MRVLFTTISMLLVCATLSAQQDMSFDEALEAMLTQNHALESQRHMVDAAYNDMRAARGLRWPQVNVIGGYTLLQRSIDIDLGGPKGIVTNSIESLIKEGVANGILSSGAASLIAQGLAPIVGPDWRYTLQKRSVGVVGVTFAMPIYAGGRINIANRVARLQFEAAGLNFDATQSHLLTELVERYYGVIVAREVVNVRREVVAATRHHLADAEAMEAEGVVAHSVVLYLSYRLTEAMGELSDAESRALIAERALDDAVGYNGVNPSDRIFLCSGVQTIDYYKDIAVKLNPLLQEAYLARNLANEGEKLSRAALLPEVAAMGGAALYSYQLSDMVPRWMVGIGVNFKLFDGLASIRRMQAAKSRAEGVDEAVESARNDILLLIDKEYYTLVNSLLSVESSRRAIAFAESYYNSAKEGFVEGITSSSDLMDACAELAASRVEYLNAAYESCKALARLLEAAGLSDTFWEYRDRGEVIDVE